MNIVKIFALAVLVATLSVSCASAQEVYGSSWGIFVNPVGPAGMDVTGEGTNSFTWGTPDTTVNPNALGFGGQLFYASLEEPFVIGILDYYNGSIVPGTHADFVDLQVVVSLVNPALFTETFQFTLELIGMPNTDDPVASADYVKLPTSFAPRDFNSGGLIYTLQILGFAVPTQNGYDFIDQFHVFEDASASAVLLAKLTVVPEPGSLLALAGPLAGMAALRMPLLRRRNRQF